MDHPQIHLNVHVDPRGSLVALEGGSSNVPFQIRRVYYIYGADPAVERGFHAHKQLRQLMICTSGACTVTLDDGKLRHNYRLDEPALGLFVDRMVWREMRDFSQDCVLLVLASEPYNREDYIFSYDEFLMARQEHRVGTRGH